MELRDLPSVDALTSLMADRFDLPEPIIAHACRLAVGTSRDAIQTGADSDPAEVAASILAEIAMARPQSVINATGVLLHTNLGRAPLARSTARMSERIHASASNVEIDVRTGTRSKRHDYLDALIPVVTGAEAGFAVNNNAGALLLAIARVAGRGGRVAVSRGELIEIGGSFRLPDLMASSGAELVEVGTTNRTRVEDYAEVAASVDAILKVHPSNYRIDGFAQEASYAELSDLSSSARIRFVADIGSGLIDERAPWLAGCDRSWLSGEPGVVQTVQTGADLVLFSGDKLFGGPQGGMIVGTKDAVDTARRHPIARAVRLDGGSIAAIADTFELYADHRVLEIPFWTMVCESLEDLDARCARAIEGIDAPIEIVDGSSIPGAGSAPGATIPTRLIKITGDADVWWSALATASMPVISSRRDGAVYIDLRSVMRHDDEAIRSALMFAVS